MSVSTAFAPIEIGRVALTVSDMPGMTAFYESLLGLSRVSADDTAVRLGAGDRVLLELRLDRAARRASPREAGLFHTAFLMPSRPALAEWLVHASDSRVPLQGASDHLVSEAIYLTDPEGNGIEVYADRPRSAWHDADGHINMGTERLDLNALARDARGPWVGAPKGLVIGHVHLQVGDLAKAQAFYGDILGLSVMARYPGASFYGAGGYHHHLAANVWNSQGADARAVPVTGLADLELLADPAQYVAITGRTGQSTFADPWGTAFTLTRKAA
ncbi:MAG: VOC family protein [Gemmobacter sp.]|nr:VOC family protein [Gemmobacter sp.]